MVLSGSLGSGVLSEGSGIRVLHEGPESGVRYKGPSFRVLSENLGLHFSGMPSNNVNNVESGSIYVR